MLPKLKPHLPAMSIPQAIWKPPDRPTLEHPYVDNSPLYGTPYRHPLHKNGLQSPPSFIPIAEPHTPAKPHSSIASDHQNWIETIPSPIDLQPASNLAQLDPEHRILEKRLWQRRTLDSLTFCRESCHTRRAIPSKTRLFFLLPISSPLKPSIQFRL